MVAILSPPVLTSSESKALAAVHEAANSTRLGRAIFDLISERLPNEMLFIAFLPIKFELASLSSEAKYKKVGDNYIRHTNRYDIWLRRSPVGPSVKAVRHSDYTPYALLKRTSFFKEVLAPINSHYGASMVAWENDQWLATVTIFRNLHQGDFTDDDMQLLWDWQRHFEVAVRRIATANEEKLDEHSLASFLWDLPTAALLFDWEFHLRHHNAAAVELCRLWLNKGAGGKVKLSHRRLVIPRELTSALDALKPAIEKAKLSRPGPLKPINLKTIRHPEIAGLFAKVYFIPSKSLTLSRGRFMIQLHHEPVTGLSASSLSRLTHLTRRERETALHAARGLSNIEIGKALHKSPGTVKVQLEHVFRKLKIKSRVHLAALLAHN
jgi:DNA-binding CsgD family transcriptional regulator